MGIDGEECAKSFPGRKKREREIKGGGGGSFSVEGYGRVNVACRLAIRRASKRERKGETIKLVLVVACLIFVIARPRQLLLRLARLLLLLLVSLGKWAGRGRVAFARRSSHLRHR